MSEMGERERIFMFILSHVFIILLYIYYIYFLHIPYPYHPLFQKFNSVRHTNFSSHPFSLISMEIEKERLIRSENVSN